jgi:peroxiredoxin
MKMMKKIFYLSVLVVFSGTWMQCKTPENRYTVKGSLENTRIAKVYLLFMNTGTLSDSAVVTGNTFKFTGTIDEPTRVLLIANYDANSYFSKRLRDAVPFILEPGKITVTGTDSLKNALVAGSPVNDDTNEWWKIVSTIRNRISSVRAELRSLDPDLDDYREKSTALRAALDSLEVEEKKAGYNFIKTNPDSYFALTNLYQPVVGYSPDPAKAREVFNLFTERLRVSKAAEAVRKKIDSWEATSVGKIAPDFTQNDPNGNPVKLSDFRGKYVLLDFWASWCGPCRAENPNVIQAYEKYKDKGFTVLGVSLDDESGRESWLKAIETDKLVWTQVSDLKGWNNDVSSHYAIEAIPANFLIDPNGKILEKNLRGGDLEKALEKYLN